MIEKYVNYKTEDGCFLVNINVKVWFLQMFKFTLPEPKLINTVYNFTVW